MSYPLVVVVIVNFNGLTDTIACIDSINRSTRINVIIVVIDNASSNQNEVGAKIENIPNIHFIRNSKNVGFGIANNQGIEWARNNVDFDYIVLLNNDTIINEDSLIQLTIPFSLNKKIGITTGKIMYYDNPEIVWYGGGEIVSNKIWPFIYDINQFSTASGSCQKRYVSFVSGCLMMFNSYGIDRLKGFDDDFFMYCEDLEICLRAHTLDVLLYYTPECTIFHKVQASSKGDGNNKTDYDPDNPNLPFLFYHMQKNVWKAYAKNYSGFHFLRFTLIFILYFFWINLFFILKRKFSILKISYRVITEIF